MHQLLWPDEKGKFYPHFLLLSRIAPGSLPKIPAMFVLEPLFSLLLLCLILYRRTHSVRHSVLSAAVVWAVLLVTMTEVLSLFHALNIFLTICSLGDCLPDTVYRNSLFR